MSNLSRRQDDNYWLKFVPADWLADTNLSMCSFAAKGLWMDMLCRMFNATTRGVLTGDMEPLSRSLGTTVDELKPLIEELEKERVFSRGFECGNGLPNDVIVSRRMYREFRLSRVRKEAGSLGGRAKAVSSKRLANAYQTPSKPLAKQQQSKQATASTYSKTAVAKRKQSPRARVRVRLRSRENKPQSNAKRAIDLIVEMEQELLCIAGDNWEGKLTEYVRRIDDCTGDTFGWRDTHLRRLAAIMAHPDGGYHLDKVICRVEAGESETKGYDAIGNPAAFINSGILQIMKTLEIAEPEATE